MVNQADEPGPAQSPTDPIRVLIVEDHEVFRDGLIAGLDRAGGFDVIGQTPDGGVAIDLARETLPDLIVMDLGLENVGGVAAIRRIHEESPSVRILVVSVSDEEPDVLEAVKAGAQGYVLKSEPSAAIVDAMRSATAGQAVFTASLASLVLGEFRRLAGLDPSEPSLTDRENEVLVLVAKGYRYGEIAKRLFLAEKTVQNHVQNILAKLQFHNRYELMRYAFRKGLDRTAD
jgi:DNA-binding NarL/FixJ family response regulator